MLGLAVKGLATSSICLVAAVGFVLKAIGLTVDWVTFSSGAALGAVGLTVYGISLAGFIKPKC